MGTTFYFGWEPALMIFLQRFMSPAVTWIASTISMFGEELLLILILGFLYWCYDKKYAQFVGINIVLGVVLNPLIKNIALRRRPYFDHEAIRCLKPVDSTADIYDISAQGYSFPSGHSMNSAIVYGSLARYRKGKRFLTVIAFVLPLLVGISRVLLGVHYPTDVLVGWAVGAAIVFVIDYLQRKIKRRGVLALILTVIALPGMFYCRTTDYFTGFGMMVGFFLALWFEEKYVRFENLDYGKPGAIGWSIVRVMGGLVVYFVANTVLKLPFSSEFLASQTMGAFLVRSARYCIVTFLAIGVYPGAFRYVERAPSKNR